MNSLEQPMSAMSVSTTKLNTPELDWSPKSLSHNNRIYSKIAVINGVNSGTLSTSTQGAFSFQIPAKVLSLKDSYVSLDLNIATAGAGATASVIAGNLGNIFSRVVCTADNNAVLFDINDFHRFGSMLHAPSMKFETLEQECVSDMEFLPSGDDDADGVALVSTIAKRSPYNVLQKNSLAQFTATATVPTIIADKPPLDRFTGGVTLVHQENNNPNSYRHFIQQTNATPIVTAYSLQFRLKDLLPHTVCALDQLLYFGGSQLQFDFYINNIDYVGFLAGTTALITSQAQLPATTFSNFQFNLCVESNVNTVNTVINKVKTEGLTIPIPYVYGSKTSIGSTSANVNQVITRSAGDRLMWVAWSPFRDTTARDIINSHTQLSCTAISGQGTFATTFPSYNTSLDNVFIKSQSTIDCTRGEHALYNRNELRGSALQGLEALSNDFVHIDSWIGKPLCEYDPSVEDGLAITENHTWGLTATFTTSNTFQHYVYYCVQRKLVVGNFSVQVV
jgi:hypothetical protein